MQLPGVQAALGQPKAPASSKGGARGALPSLQSPPKHTSSEYGARQITNMQ